MSGGKGPCAGGVCRWEEQVQEDCGESQKEHAQKRSSRTLDCFPVSSLYPVTKMGDSARTATKRYAEEGECVSREDSAGGGGPLPKSTPILSRVKGMDRDQLLSSLYLPSSCWLKRLCLCLQLRCRGGGDAPNSFKLIR
jgi:hypothetical protein